MQDQAKDSNGTVIPEWDLWSLEDVPLALWRCARLKVMAALNDSESPKSGHFVYHSQCNSSWSEVIIWELSAPNEWGMLQIPTVSWTIHFLWRKGWWRAFHNYNVHCIRIVRAVFILAGQPWAAVFAVSGRNTGKLSLSRESRGWFRWLMDPDEAI